MKASQLLEQARKVRCLISDIDGVLTDGSLYLDTENRELKKFHVQDGLGLKLLMHANIHVAIITTSNNLVIENRMRQLGIELFFTGQVNKLAAYETIKKRLSLDDTALAYVGDDLPDLPIIRQVGLGIAVANAVSEVKEFSNWQTTATGGQGAVREVCDLILKAQGKMDVALARYLET